MYRDCLARLRVNARGLPNSILVSVKSTTGGIGAPAAARAVRGHLIHRPYRNIRDRRQQHE